MDPLDKLKECPSWRLEKLSPNTYTPDVIIKHDMTPTEIKAVTDLMKRKTCYRCRLAKGRFYYGATADEAIEAALKGLEAP